MIALKGQGTVLGCGRRRCEPPPTLHRRASSSMLPRPSSRRNDVHGNGAAALPPSAAASAERALLLPAVAMDVEFGHWRRAVRRQQQQQQQPAGAGAGQVAAASAGVKEQEEEEVAVAAWVAVVDEGGEVLLDTRIAQEQDPALLATTTVQQDLGEEAAAVSAAARKAGRNPAGELWKHIGGVSLDSCCGAPTRAEVGRILAELLQGRLLVGHGVVRDAEALGFMAAEAQKPQKQGGRQGADGWASGFLDLTFDAVASGGGGGGDGDGDGSESEPRGAQRPQLLRVAAYDTRRFPGFQGRGGTSFALARLAQEHLGRAIQQTPATSSFSSSSPSSSKKSRAARRAPHDAVEDARALMDLWQRVAFPSLLVDASSPSSSSSSSSPAYARLVELQTAALLSGKRPQG